MPMRRFGRPLPRADSGRIPVVIFTGFLGAGKTSLIRKLIATPAGEQSAIVVNEFGEIGLDQALFGQEAETTILLGNGCLCCTVRSDLQETLRSLYMQRNQGTAIFRRVIIETSGLADPGPVLQTLLRDRALAQEFHLRALIAVADPFTIESVLDRHPVARAQIAQSDRIVVSKADLASAEQMAQVMRRLRAERPGRPLASIGAGELDPDFLLREDLDLDARGTGFFASPVEHDDPVSSFPLFFDRPVPWDGFVQTVRALTQLRGSDVLRVKGLVAVEGCSGPVLFHAVQQLVHEPIELREWPDDDHRSRLVFITRGINRDQVESLFSAMFGLAAHSSSIPAREVVQQG